LKICIETNEIREMLDMDIDFLLTILTIERERRKKRLDKDGVVRTNKERMRNL